MTRPTLPTLALCGLLAATAPAAAQYPGGYQTGPAGQYLSQPRVAPPVSPYLNLLQRGNAGVNYYNFVRPAFQPQAGVPVGQSPASAYLPEDVTLDPQDPTARFPR